ncbi:MAG: M20/M25/M40 family metallo-hydrolase [Spirochaetota bacterium]
MISEVRLIEMFKDMIKLNTTNPGGGEKVLTDYIGRILADHDIPYTVIEPASGRANIIASIGPDTGKRPVVLISHLDVVPCDGQDWTYPPFEAIEAEGFIYGRGTLDTKHLTVMELAAFLHASTGKLDRKIYFVATADEEKGSTNGMPEVVKSYSEDFTNAYVINEGGGFYIEEAGKPFYLCTVGEKGRCDVHVTITGDAGPASFISTNKATTKFTQLLERLSSHEFPLQDSRVYREFMRRVGTDISNPVLKNFAHYNAHDAWILQEYTIGSQINVLPYHIEFDFALQLLPGRTLKDAQRTLEELFSGIDADYSITNFVPGFESETGDFFAVMEELVGKHYTRAGLLPVYALGRTDGRFLGRLPADVYGFSPVTSAITFEEVLGLVHQRDEKIDRESVIRGAAYLTDLITLRGCDYA